MFSTLSHKLHSTGMTESLTIARRFRGPLTSANGGYASGLLAQAVDARTVEVTLRLPPPLERPLVLAEDDGRTLLLDGEALVAEARPAELDLVPPPPPALEEAQEAARAESAGLGLTGLRGVLRLRHPAGGRRARDPCPPRRGPRGRARRDDVGRARSTARDRLGGDRLPRCLRRPATARAASRCWRG